MNTYVLSPLDAASSEFQSHFKEVEATMHSLCAIPYKKMVATATVALTAFSVYALPMFGKAIGSAVEHVVAREVAEEVAERTLVAGSARAASSALAGVTAKQLVGAGIGTSLAISVPVAAYKLADGRQEVDKARAETIRTVSDVIAQEIPKHPELARQALEAVGDSTDSPLYPVVKWGCRVVGLVCLLYLAGFLLRAVAFARRGVAAMAVEPSDSTLIKTSINNTTEPNR